MRIMDEYQTIQCLMDERTSIARYGDGELKLCFGRDAKSQKWDPGIQYRLLQILKSGDKHCLVGIPRIYQKEDRLRMSERKWGFWSHYANGKFLSLYDKNKQYGSAFITRPDAAPEIDCIEYYNLLKKIWLDRPVVVMHGSGTGFLKNKSLVENASSVDERIGPITDAFLYHKLLVKGLLDCSDNDCAILISLGPEATVLAYDLAQAGRQALDLGHLGMFYAHIHPKDRNWDGISREIC
jgi:glycosyltransferase family protein